MPGRAGGFCWLHAPVWVVGLAPMQHADLPSWLWTSWNSSAPFRLGLVRKHLRWCVMKGHDLVADRSLLQRLITLCWFLNNEISTNEAGEIYLNEKGHKDKQWKLNPLVKQSNEPLLPWQSEARVLQCCRKSWEERVTNYSPYGMGCCTDRTLNSQTGLSCMCCTLAWLGNSLAAGTHLPWSCTGITHLAPGHQHLADRGLLQLQEFQHICFR